MMREAVPHMIAQGRGSVVNVTAASSGAFSKEPVHHDRLLLYSLTKSGMNRLTTYMAQELREHDIAVNGLSPGVVLSDRMIGSGPIPGAKPATPEVLGPAMLYLAAQTASRMTGQIVHTDAFERDWPFVS